MKKFPSLYRPADGYVFIVTYGRSGSTLLQNLLNSIPGYCIRGENNNTLYHLARAWDTVAQAREMQGLRKRGAPSAQTHPWYGAELTRPEHYGRTLADGFVREILRPDPGTRVAGFKEIRFHQDEKFFRQYMSFMHRFFPKARFIFNTRDHAAVARSGWWAEKDPAEVAAQLTRAEKLYDAYARAFPKKSLQLRYEDYTGNPDGLRPLFDFLGEPFDEAMVARVLGQKLDHLKSGTAAG
ncbi:sulfotransferase [Actibacterium sp. MT2.3-13A]|uniref:sulfotransferase family protein n=1 Tax=Actibacterium sp. MT2.3-13A TaxID=2828332 RepID=UPI001BAC00B1|nr:sulfotransferase [Actibacterium sp. MT2.3-13A]